MGRFQDLLARMFDVALVLAGAEKNQEEVLVDDTGRAVKQSLSTDAPIYLTGIPR